jgi:hypothetical protein
MEIGTQYEGEARTEYWMATGTEVQETGFVLHPTLDFLGASPDGLILPTHGLEIKVPMLKTHIRYLREKKVPEDYVPQMQCNMLCCGLPAWAFVSYCPSEVYPELPERFRLFTAMLEADEVSHRQMEEAAIRTMQEVTALVERLSNDYPERDRRYSEPAVKELPYSAEQIADPTSDAYGFLDAHDLTP